MNECMENTRRKGKYKRNVYNHKIESCKNMKWFGPQIFPLAAMSEQWKWDSLPHKQVEDWTKYFRERGRCLYKDEGNRVISPSFIGIHVQKLWKMWCMGRNGNPNIGEHYSWSEETEEPRKVSRTECTEQHNRNIKY